MKQWGRVKIRYELKQKRLSEYCIKTAMKEINEAEYLKTLGKLAETKWKSLKSEKNIFTKKAKATSFLMQRGFEAALIQDVLKTL